MKELHIHIATQDLKLLHDNCYSLCIAKKTEDAGFTVRWQVLEDFTEHNLIRWENSYTIFASKTRVTNHTIFKDITAHDITWGQRAILAKEGLITDMEQAFADNYFELKNDYKPIYPGLCQNCPSPDGSPNFCTFYLSPLLCIPGIFQVKPVDEILVWFEQNAQAETVLPPDLIQKNNGALSHQITLKLTATDNAAILFENYCWSILPH